MLYLQSKMERIFTKVGVSCELPTRFLTPYREFVDIMRRNLAQSIHDA
jgi:hypothetical protein